MWAYNYSPSLEHHGILGMKWGVRRFQNADGSLTAAGRKRYGAETKPREQNTKEKAKTASSQSTTLRQVKNEEKAKEYQKKAEQAKSDAESLRSDGATSEAFRKKYGSAADLPDAAFALLYGKTKKYAVNEMTVASEKKTEVYQKAAKDKAAGKLTDTQKMIIGAASVAVVLAAAYGGKKYLDSIGDSREFLRLAKIKAGDKISFDDFWKKYEGSETRLFDAISNDAYSQLSPVDVKLASGQVFHRISGDAEKSLTRTVKNIFGQSASYTKDRLYLAFTEEDVKRYKAVLPKKFFPMWGQSKNTAYDVAYKALTEISSPSAKKRVDIYSDLLGSDRSAYALALQMVNSVRASAGKQGVSGSISPEALARESYSVLSLSLADPNNQLVKKYIAAVKQLGYNAIIDDNDGGRLSDSPIIVLDPVKNVVREGATALSSADIESAAKSLTELLNRK